MSLQEHDRDDQSDPIFNWDPVKTQPTLVYAWSWFGYHAQQRLTAFNYFLVVAGLLTSGYVTCYNSHLYSLQIVIGIIGALISIGFLALDVRNEELVNDGRDALRKLEHALGMAKGIHRADYDRIKETKICGIKVSTKHGFWFRRIESIVLLLSVAAVIVGAIGGTRTAYPANKPPSLATPATPSPTASDKTK
jgi:hypothetical protein